MDCDRCVAVANELESVGNQVHQSKLTTMCTLVEMGTPRSAYLMNRHGMNPILMATSRECGMVCMRLTTDTDREAGCSV